MSLEQIVADGIELTGLLRARYPNHPILLAGNSWGSIVGLTMARKAPRDFCAYVGVSQFVAAREGIERSTACVRDLGGDAPVQTAGADFGAEHLITLMRAVARSGGSVFGAQDFGPIETMREQSLIKREQWERQGEDQVASLHRLLPEILGVDFRTLAPQPVPAVAFLVGERDCVTPTSLVREYATLLSAPVVTIPRSGHLPHAEQPDRVFQTIADLTTASCSQ